VQADPDKLTFEMYSGNRPALRPLVRREAGRGILGAFHPKVSLTLQPQVPFDRGDGVLKFCRGRFEFSSIYIPTGVTVTVRSRDAVELLSASDVRIDGAVLLETPRAQRPEGLDQTDLESYRRRLATKDFGARILAAGDVEIRGDVRHQLVGGHLASPLSVVGRKLTLGKNALPRGSILAAAEIVGEAQGVTQVKFVPTPGLPTTVHRAEAAAWTPWQALPAGFVGRVDARFRGLDGPLEVFLQIAPPDPTDPGIPYVEAATLTELHKLPLRSKIEVGRSSHVRFLLKAKVIGGKPLPSVKSLVILSER
jgi:hypothetical protein